MKPTDILGNIKLYNADCMEVMKTFKDKQFDLAIIDPPYGIDIAKWDAIDMKPTKEYFDELFRVSQDQIIWGGNYFDLPHSEGWICWDKTFKYNQKLAVGEFELAWSSLDYKHTFLRYTSCGNFQGWDNPRANYEKKKSFHPTSKPVDLYRGILQRFAKEGDTILDTHFGSLSIGIACHDMKFDLTAIELDKDYYEMAKQRLETHQRQLTLF